MKKIIFLFHTALFSLGVLMMWVGYKIYPDQVFIPIWAMASGFFIGAGLILVVINILVGIIEAIDRIKS